MQNKMKKWYIVCGMITALLATTALADARSDLQQRLGKVKYFQADFTQSVVTAEGVKAQESRGQLWIQRPNLFRWETRSPDESVLISDGTTLWFYNPLVEQATANWLNSATNNTPFILITRNNRSDWDQYQIKQNGDDFQLSPKNQRGNLRQFDLTVDKVGTIKKFTAIEQDGQRSIYTLNNAKNSVIDSAKFRFVLPKGSTLDDQRQRQTKP